MSNISCSIVDCNSAMFQSFYLTKTSMVKTLYYCDVLCYRERSTSLLTLFSLIHCEWLLCANCLHVLSLSPLLFPPLPPFPPMPTFPLAFQLLCIITEKEEDVAAFKDYQEPTTSSPPLEKVLAPTQTWCAYLLNALQCLKPICCHTCRQHLRRMCL